MAIEIDLINSKTSKEGEFKRLPKTGMSFNWRGKVYSFTLDEKSLTYGVEVAPKSKLNQIKTLPRVSGEFDYAGKRLTFKAASFLEALKNVRDHKVNSLSKASATQLDEILLPQTQFETCQKSENKKNLRDENS